MHPQPVTVMQGFGLIQLRFKRRPDDVGGGWIVESHELHEPIRYLGYAIADTTTRTWQACSALSVEPGGVPLATGFPSAESVGLYLLAVTSR